METLVSQTLVNMDMSHEVFITNLNEKDKYGEMEEGIRTMKSSDELNEERDKKLKQHNCKWKYWKCRKSKNIFF